MTKYRERSNTVEAHQHPSGIAGRWEVKYLDGPKRGTIETYSTETLTEKFEVVPVVATPSGPPAALEAARRMEAIPDAALDFLAPGLFSGDATSRHQIASPMKVEVAQQKIRERAEAFLSALRPEATRESLETLVEAFDGWIAAQGSESTEGADDAVMVAVESARALLATTQEGGGELEVPPLRSGADPGGRKMEGRKAALEEAANVARDEHLSTDSPDIKMALELVEQHILALLSRDPREEASMPSVFLQEQRGGQILSKVNVAGMSPESAMKAIKRLYEHLGQEIERANTDCPAQAALAQSRTPASQGEVRTEAGPGGPEQPQKGNPTKERKDG